MIRPNKCLNNEDVGDAASLAISEGNKPQIVEMLAIDPGRMSNCYLRIGGIACVCLKCGMILRISAISENSIG